MTPFTDSGFVNTGSGRLFYESRGRGKAVILIHAGRIDSRMWDRQLQTFSEKYRVIRYDIKGYGKSDTPNTKFSDREDLHSLLGKLNIKAAHLIGSSNGGSVAIDFALAHPDMVASLVVVGTNIDGYEMDEEESKAWAGFKELWKREDELVQEGRLEEVVKLEMERWHRHSPKEAREKLFKMHIENTRAYKTEPWKLQVHESRPSFKRVSEIKAPTLVITGDLDVPGIKMMNDKLHKMMPGSRKVMILGADHLVNLSRPDEFDKTVIDFLDDLSIQH